ncbi:MAG: undecaprenyldiphospho-muramoylpentapeptide beta-N-acetylglucosaminyltransferase [Candidatus Taylorbacteria bacterium RIFCSPHIGHO2_01_FULL_46_22b]|uniref:UDP-N-acetylglucosamine--N-acetylmuramyl-(pentapeptide) pyrophosphoryl-undecaprenol N-acetylglucosamine transferase n=1 Tax=Candidatus Taylorbacteria bacterium RIFCSPHIGHO2_01_FULL_46_22b TaxID=1802301 RepID=A0A1G2M3K7_9BACT|nr:MAG: undecaprenyldiphospho-muramoylpentapeptide beta-N-acetylglucosaminyltransferase [Candidatus Taylorbacteria bacterium RIFCSPHIGHO2_01_FULL_46_22b]
MKILLTGGGSGGHFYPLIAVAEELNRITHEEKLVTPELFFMSDAPYDQKALFDNDIVFKKVPAGKLRRYVSIQNFFDIFKTIWGTIHAFFTVFAIYPDVIFSKGGYGSFPATLAARILRIPLIIHESDSVPGRANAWAGKFATRIAVSFSNAVQYFPLKKTAWTGNPVRNEVKTLLREGVHQLLHFDAKVPTLLVLGGSQGAQLLNNTLLDVLNELVREFQVIHQTGPNNFKEVSNVSSVALQDNQFKNRYRPFSYLDTETLKMAAGAADIILSRAGAGAISEIAIWGKPSIIVPITDSNGDHQRKNAIEYEKSGACVVIEEGNLKPHILFADLKRLIEDKSLLQKMSAGAQQFAKPDAAEKVARGIIAIALKHEN